MIRPTLLLCIACCFLGCASTGVHPESVTASWRCRNDLEITCGDGACAAETEDGFTPMSVSFDDSGAISV